MRSLRVKTAYMNVLTSIYAQLWYTVPQFRKGDHWSLRHISLLRRCLLKRNGTN